MKTVLLFPPESAQLDSSKILGLSYVERVRFSLSKAGFETVIPFVNAKETLTSQEEFLVFFSRVLLTDESAKKLKTISLEPESVLFFDGVESFFLVRSKRLQTFLQESKVAISFFQLRSLLQNRLKVMYQPFPRKDWIRFSQESDLPFVEGWLLRHLIKENEGFMSRHLERKISLAITRRLVNTRITPNVMTLVSAACGLLGASFFLPASSGWAVAGSLLFWLHSVLDGCDGELARLKFLESKLGGLLDFWSDNAVHCAVFAAIAYGLSRREGGDAPFILGVMAVSGTLLSAGFVYWNNLRKKNVDGPFFTSVLEGTKNREKNPLEKVTDFLARRDFIYLVILLSLLGKVEWFLWLGAVGAPFYFFILLVLAIV
ncbi:MAG: CDP-alcohol phosphatidyltransferase family protein [Elusimicrobia bacterium]|nr:CDP-alcohol phosphatidyltransferase family protein [Elusimicrobiota bacterium]